MKTDNELIEEFWIEHGGKPHMKEDLSFYESDWQMLMPVVEKIESLGFQVHIWNDATLIKLSFKYKSRFKGWHQIGNIDDKGKLASVYKAIVRFFKWYNLQQTKIK